MSEFKAVFNKITEKENGVGICVVKVYPRGEPGKEEIAEKTAEIQRKLNCFDEMLEALIRCATEFNSNLDYEMQLESDSKTDSDAQRHRNRASHLRKQAIEVMNVIAKAEGRS